VAWHILKTSPTASSEEVPSSAEFVQNRLRQTQTTSTTVANVASSAAPKNPPMNKRYLQYFMNQGTLSLKECVA